MGYRALKWTRVSVSLAFLVAISLFFVDFRHLIPESWISGTLYLQFVPSVIRFLKVFSLGAAGFLVILVLTILFGRVYCSSVCPLGIIQDVISRIAGWLRSRRKRRFRYSKPFTRLRYSILVITLVAVFAGSIILVNLLDPYSNFGRIFTYLVKPVIVSANNLVAGMLEKRNIFTLFRVDLYPVRWELVIYPLLVLIVVAWLSARRGRLFCNTLCPVGTLLGVFSGYSFFRIRIDEAGCTSCGLCVRACKSECMDIKTGIVDHSRCVACYNCLDVCPESAVKYDMKGQAVLPVFSRSVKREGAMEFTDRGKRRFVLGSLAYLFGTLGISVSQEAPVPQKQSTIPEDRNFPVCPPGSKSIGQFNDACTACSLCVSVCPTRVLQPSFLEFGLAGMMQPRMDYHAGFCNYECVKCTEICPAGAMLPVHPDEKKTIQLGKAVFVEDNCIVKTEKTDCGACSEHCPTKAVYMIPYEGSLVIPEVNNNICIGCGACEYACPTIPYKAIYIDGNDVHQVADKPEIQEKSEIILEEEFPF